MIDQGASRAGRLGAVLRGEQVEPAKVTTSARGTGTVTLDADQTEIGFTLTLSPLPNPVGTVTTFAQAVDALLRGKTYFQVHTQDNPGGEVRGQIGPASLSATLSGANEVPPVTTSGTGSGSFTVNSDQDALAFSVTFTGLGSATTGSHIHKGNPGENGPVIFPLASGSFASPITGLLTSANANPGTDDQFLEDVDDILSGETYVNVHTVNNGDGEIRGQIQP
ncbi:MAG: CHRD domain-containing protein [Deltaproteobacteria bacterium]|nr:CHRD domain-containing protein [Deltaproteobacteria bacterium]